MGGVAGLARVQGGEPKMVFEFTIERGRIVGVELIADPPEPIPRLDVAML